MQRAKTRHLDSDAAFKQEVPIRSYASDGGLEGNDLMLPLFFVCRTCVRCFTPSYGRQRSGAAVRATRPRLNLILQRVHYPLWSLSGFKYKEVALLDVFFSCGE